jgi:hypothetical protein
MDVSRQISAATVAAFETAVITSQVRAKHFATLQDCEFSELDLSPVEEGLVKRSQEALIVNNFQMIQEAFDESDQSLGLLLDGGQVAKKFWNRTFTLPTGKVYFNQNGDHFPDILVQQWNLTTGNLEACISTRP